MRKIYLSRLEERSCYTAEISPDASLPQDTVLMTLRELFRDLDEDLIGVLSNAVQVLHWDETNRFCSRCGSQTENSETERAKVCPDCGFTAWFSIDELPRIPESFSDCSHEPVVSSTRRLAIFERHGP